MGNFHPKFRSSVRGIIVQEYLNFYSKLYASLNTFSTVHADTFFQDIPLPQVTKDHIELMEGDFVEGEISIAIKGLHTSKAARRDFGP